MQACTKNTWNNNLCVALFVQVTIPLEKMLPTNVKSSVKVPFSN